MASGRRPGRPRGAQQDPAERRANLLTGAEAAIRELGPDVSMEQIADRANVSKATLYDYFDGKTGLTEALLDRYGLRLMDSFGAAVVRPLSAREVVGGGLGIFVRFIAEDPQIYRFVVRHADGELLLSEITRPISALLRSVGAGDPDALAHAILGSVVTSTQWWSHTNGHDLEEFVDTLVSFVLGGLAASGIDVEREDPVDLTEVVAAIALVRELAAHPAPA